MAVGQGISFETLVGLVERLSPAQRRDLLARLEARAQGQALSPAEKLALLQRVQVDVAVVQEPSVRRGA